MRANPLRAGSEVIATTAWGEQIRGTVLDYKPYRCRCRLEDGTVRYFEPSALAPVGSGESAMGQGGCARNAASKRIGGVGSV